MRSCLGVTDVTLGKRRVLGHDYEGYWRAAGNADGGRADDTVRDKRRAAEHDGDGCVRVCSAEVFGGPDQFFCDQALAPLEVPALLAAAQLLGGHRPEFPFDVIEPVSSSATAPGRRSPCVTRLRASYSLLIGCG
jgi:hypothetical protein